MRTWKLTRFVMLLSSLVFFACLGEGSSSAVTGNETMQSSALSSVCTYTLSSSGNEFGAPGGPGTVDVSSSASYCSWSATSNVSWITVSSGGSGTGDGTVSYLVSANTSGKDRTGKLTIADKTFTITQEGGILKWSFTTEVPNPPSVISPPAIGSDGTLYVGSSDNNLYAINSDGTVRWSYTTGGSLISSPAIGSDGTIYAVSYDKLYALNSDGTLKWVYAPISASQAFPDWAHYIYSSPAIGKDGTVYVGGGDGLYAISSDGTLEWFYAAGDASSPAIGRHGTVYFTSGGKLYAIRSDGTLKWWYSTPSFLSPPAIGSDGAVYVGGDKLYAINGDGTLKWTWGIVGRSLSLSSPSIGSDGTLYVSDAGADSFIMVAAIKSDGSLKWKYSSARRGTWANLATPAVSSDGTVYVGGGGNLYAINSDGTLRWSFTAAESVSFSPAIGSDGTVYYSSTGIDRFGQAAGPSTLFALSGSSGLANSAWPMFMHDARHTGQSEKIIHLQLTLPASAKAGKPITFKVKALDESGNIVTDYSGTVHFTSTDSMAILPADATLTDGKGTFSATFKTSGKQTITATDTVSSAITGTSGKIAVRPAAATHFEVAAPATVTARVAFTFTVTALDQFDNRATAYAGIVHFESTDTNAKLPADSTFTSGKGKFSAKLKTEGSQTITAKDTVNASVTGTSSTIEVQ